MSDDKKKEKIEIPITETELPFDDRIYLNQLIAMFETDNKSLLRWMREINKTKPIIYIHKEKHDRRKRYISRHDAQLIAMEHGRSLRDLPNLPVSIRGCHRMIGELLAEIDRLKAQIDELEAFKKQYTSLDALGLKSDGFIGLDDKSYTRTHHRRHNDDVVTSTLPEGLVSLSAFCEEHDIPISTIRKAIQTGRLQGIYTGNWRSGRATILYAVDSQQQDQILHRWGNKKEI